MVGTPPMKDIGLYLDFNPITRRQWGLIWSHDGTATTFYLNDSCRYFKIPLYGISRRNDKLIEKWFIREFLEFKHLIVSLNLDSK
jgi:hypothetical protein